MTPAGTSNELDVQNEWEENTHNTYMHSRRSFVDDVPLILSFPTDHVLLPDWQPRILIILLGGKVETRSVNVKNTHTHTHQRLPPFYVSRYRPSGRLFFNSLRPKHDEKNALAGPCSLGGGWMRPKTVQSFIPSFISAIEILDKQPTRIFILVPILNHGKRLLRNYRNLMLLRKK